MADPDKTPPVLVSIKLPKLINVNKDDADATFTVGATDQGLGVSSVTLHLDHSIQHNGSATDYLFFNSSTDSFTDGRSSLSEEIDTTTGAGTYKVDYAYVYDKAGNYTYYDAGKLAALGVDTQFVVKSKAVADTTPPVLSAISLPKSINVTKGDQTVSLKVGATDQGLGVSSVTLHLDHAIQHNGSATDYLFFNGSTDSFSDGKSVLSEEIDSTTGAGTYKIDYAYVYDKAGHYTYYDAGQLATLGVDTQFNIKSKSVADTTPPTLTAIKLPGLIDVSHGDQEATFTVGAADKGLGVNSVTLHLDHSFQHNGTATDYLFFNNSTDSFLDGKSTLSEEIDSSTADGTYKVDYAYVYDKAGNYTYYDAGKLAALGVDTQFTVGSGSPEAVANHASSQPIAGDLGSHWPDTLLAPNHFF